MKRLIHHEVRIAFYSMTSGRKKIPALAISDIAKALGVTPNDLFGFESIQPPEA